MHAISEIPPVGDCAFYHVMDLPGLGTQGGPISWDLRGRFRDYTANVDLRGKTVLDVGAASGFLSFEAEKAGAIVTSYDVESAADWELMPHPDAEDSRRFFHLIRNSYFLSHRCLSSKASLVTGSVYDLPRRVGRHQISLVGQILVHLRNPLDALREIAAVTTERMIIVEGSFHSDAPTALFLGADGNFHSWWRLSDALYRNYLATLGFRIETIKKGAFRCNDSRLQGDVELWTFVASRTESLEKA